MSVLAAAALTAASLSVGRGASASALEIFDSPLGPRNRSLLGIICNVRDGLFPILLALGIIAFLIAGLLYFTAGGDEAKTASAKKALTVAIIGIVLAMLSFGLPAMIAELFNVDVTTLPQQCR